MDINCVNSVEPHFFSGELCVELKKHGILVRVENEFSFAEFSQLRTSRLGSIVRRFRDCFFVVKVVLRRFVKSNAGVDLVTSNPWYLPSVLLLINRLLKRKTVLLVLDLYPDALIAAGILNEASLFARILRKCTSACLRHADASLFIGEVLRDYATASYPDIGRPRVVCLGPSQDLLTSRLKRDKAEIKGAIQFIYSGNAGVLHDTKTLREAFSILGTIDNDLRFQFHIVARGSQARSFAKDIHPKFLRYHEPLGATEWSSLMNDCDISVVTLASGAEKISFPSKIWSALAVGHPVIVIAARDSDIANLVLNNDLGWWIANDDAVGLASLITRVSVNSEELLNKRKNIAEFCSKHLTPHALASNWAKALKT